MSSPWIACESSDGTLLTASICPRTGPTRSSEKTDAGGAGLAAHGNDAAAAAVLDQEPRDLGAGAHRDPARRGGERVRGHEALIVDPLVASHDERRAQILRERRLERAPV